MLVPAIHFFGTCADAIALYQRVFGAEVLSVAYYKDAPLDSPLRAAAKNPYHIMHAELIIAGTRLNMCDVPDDVVSGNRYLLNVFMDTIDEVSSAYHLLSEGGRVVTALAPQFWTAMYGEVEDRFGIHWQLMAK